MKTSITLSEKFLHMLDKLVENDCSNRSIFIRRLIQREYDKVFGED